MFNDPCELEDERDRILMKNYVRKEYQYFIR